MEIINIIVVSVLGYLIGALPFAVWVARLKGVDILSVGSGNPGATNVKRAVGSTAGNTVFLLDMGKGLVAAGGPLLLMQGAQSLAIIGLLAAIIGHSFSVFIRFRGGKGVATTMGGLLAIAPLPLAVGLLAWVGLFFASRYVSVASIGFGLVLPLAGYLFNTDAITLFFLILLAALIVVRHRANISRLLAGAESRFERSKKG